jgi:hypothetical protein
MLSRLSIVALILICPLLATAGTTAIGVASARGEMRVDGYTIRGNATLFDGTIVETDQAAATLRLDNGEEMILSSGSRGTMYRDRLVLEKGATELMASSRFPVEANGLRITPSQPNSQAVVSLRGSDKVEVAALTGEFKVTGDEGLPLASVPSHTMMAFAMQASDSSDTAFTGTGPISLENGKYYLTIGTGTKYEIRGKSFQSSVGKTVTVQGRIDVTIPPSAGALAVVFVKNRKKEVLITTLVIGGAVGAAVGTFEATQYPPAASR